MNFELVGHVVSLLEDLGQYAVAPESPLFFSIRGMLITGYTDWFRPVIFKVERMD